MIQRAAYMTQDEKFEISFTFASIVFYKLMKIVQSFHSCCPFWELKSPVEKFQALSMTNAFKNFKASPISRNWVKELELWNRLWKPADSLPPPWKSINPSIQLYKLILSCLFISKLQRVVYIWIAWDWDTWNLDWLERRGQRFKGMISMFFFSVVTSTGEEFAQCCIIFVVGHVWCKMVILNPDEETDILANGVQIVLDRVQEIVDEGQIKAEEGFITQCCRCGIQSPLANASREIHGRKSHPALKVSISDHFSLF